MLVLKKMTGIKFGFGLPYEKNPAHILFLPDCLHLNFALLIEMLVWLNQSGGGKKKAFAHTMLITLLFLNVG